jgi:hypothetical protein
MKTNWKTVILAGALLAGLSGTAAARDNVSFSIGFGIPAPVYVAPPPPPPVYYRPAPVYYTPPAYYAPAPAVVYYEPGWSYGYAYGHGHRHGHHRHHHRHHR